MILEISTADRDQVLVKLHINGHEYSYHDDNQFGSQVLLPLIEKALTDHGLAHEDIKEIKVATGPGSFTGLRVGVSVANALGMALKIPVNGKEVETEISYS